MTTRPSRPLSASTIVRRHAVVTLKLLTTGLSAPGDRTAAKIEKLLAWLESIKAELGIPKSIREAGVQEADFRHTLTNCLKMPSMTSAPALTRVIR